MKLPHPLIPAAVQRRLNRFTVEVAIDGGLALAHLANSGRVRELLAPGTPALLAPRAGVQRKTRYDLALVRLGEEWVSTDARLPNALLREALVEGRLAACKGYTHIAAEVRWGESRLDFVLADGQGGLCLVETKSVTLVEGGVALFPDAPTTRGLCHLRTLTEARRAGQAAAVVFVIQRADAQVFRPYDDVDPVFGSALREAAATGVAVLAYRCSVTPEEACLAEPVEVVL